MKRLLLPVLAAGAVALALAGTTAGARPSSGAHAAKSVRVSLKSVPSLGKVLVGPNGHVLYLFLKDHHGKSACYSACATGWPPLITGGKPKAGRGVSARKLGTVKRRDGKRQVTYNGHPLYYYIGDSKAGQANGQGLNAFGANWYVLNAKGNKIDND